MKKKGIKLVKVILVIMLLVNIFSINNTKSYAKRDNQEVILDEGVTGEDTEEILEESEEGLSTNGMSDISKNPSAWVLTTSTGSTDLDEKIGIIASVVRTIGIIVSVGTLSVIGIKFMLGSVEEKAQYKQTMMPWIVGAIMIFAMTTIPTLLYDMSKGMF